jgi:hypothetical protein
MKIIAGIRSIGPTDSALDQAWATDVAQVIYAEDEKGLIVAAADKEDSGTDPALLRNSRQTRSGFKRGDG